jgi:hypothetical protein
MILNLPVALLDQDFVQQRMVDPVLALQGARDPKKPENWSLKWPDSAASIWASRLMRMGGPNKDQLLGWLFTDAAVHGTILITVVNRRRAAVTLGIAEGSAFYGQVLHAPVTLGWDAEHKHTLDLAPNIIPAARPDDRQLGVGVVTFCITNPSYGCGGAFSISLGDTPNEDPIWFGTQFAYGAFKGTRFSVALTNDRGSYTDLGDFYTKECDDKREAEASVTLAVGHGKDPTVSYAITARAAPMFADVPAWAHGGDSKNQHYQVTLDIS